MAKEIWLTEWNYQIKTRIEHSKKRKPTKYLAILEPDTIKQLEIQKEYIRRIRKLLETKLWSRNLIKGINIWAVLFDGYSGLTFLVQVFKIVVDSWKFPMLVLYILWDDQFLISNEQLQQHLEYFQLKPDCYRWWISKMHSGREDTLEERYAIKLCFKLSKMPQKCMKCFRLFLEHLAWIEHQFLSGIRDSRKAGSLWGMMWGVGRVSKSIHQSLLAKGLGLALG